MELIAPPALNPGDTLGVFTPSSPSYTDNPGLFENGVRNLERLGFKVKLGSLTQRRASQGYRSGTPQERAAEFMELILDPEVKGLIATIGGNNSNSMIPYLDFAAIRKHPKVVSGYSDVTSLHLSILHYSGLRTFYGPGVMTWFGEYPDGIPENVESFLDAVTRHRSGARTLQTPTRWSNHKRDWASGAWKNVPREWQKNEGWRVLNSGSARGPLIAANLNTLLVAAGTPYFPNLKGKILLVESMAAPFAAEERQLRHLQLTGAFDEIAGLLVGKPEWPDANGAPFTHDELILEIVGQRSYPIVSQFDCGHTLPMLTLAQMTPIELVAKSGFDTRVEIMEPMIESAAKR